MTTAVAPRRMAPLQQIAAYWAGTGAPEFPNLEARAIGWGEPFCFRCSWLAPVPEEGTITARWASAKGWLDRAHIVAHEAGGSGKAENLVPLCSLCHSLQPIHADGPAVIKWIAEAERCPWWWQFATDGLIGEPHWRPFPGRGEMRSLRLRVDEVYRKTRAEFDRKKLQAA
jgi:hypothetical protein